MKEESDCSERLGGIAVRECARATSLLIRDSEKGQEAREMDHSSPGGLSRPTQRSSVKMLLHNVSEKMDLLTS